MNFSKKRSGENIYIQILEWAYERIDNGFRRDDLIRDFSLEGDKWQWVEKNFFFHQAGQQSLISYLKSEEEKGERKDYFTLTEEGISRIIAYYKLKEAQKSGILAMRTAMVAIFISIAIGIAQIYVQIKYASCANPVPLDLQRSVSLTTNN